MDPNVYFKIRQVIDQIDLLSLKKLYLDTIMISLADSDEYAMMSEKEIKEDFMICLKQIVCD